MQHTEQSTDFCRLSASFELIEPRTNKGRINFDTSSSRDISSIILIQKNKQSLLTNVQLSQSKATASQKKIRTRSNIAKYDIHDKEHHTVLVRVLIKQPGLASHYRMQVSNMLTVNFIFCPSKVNEMK